MKTHDQLEAEFERLIQSHYYSEDYTVWYVVRKWLEGLSPHEQAAAHLLFRERVRRDPSVVQAGLSRVFEVPDLVGFWCEQLGEIADHVTTTREILITLQHYHNAFAFDAVLPFLDSELEMEALRTLVAVDVPRSIPYLAQAMGKDQLLETCLHIFQDLRNRVGEVEMVNVLKQVVTALPAAKYHRVSAMFQVKSANVNPFKEDEIKRFLYCVEPE